MKRSLFVLVTLVLVMVFGLVGVGCAPKPAPEVTPIPKVHNWRLQSWCSSADGSWFVTVVPYITEVAKATDGTVKITPYEPGMLCGAGGEEMIEAVSMGLIDMAMHWATGYTGMIPESVLSYGLPYGWETAEEVFEVYYDYGMVDFLRPIYEKHNVFYIQGVSNVGNWIFPGFPVEKMEDFQGKKMRAGGPQAEVLSAIGGSPVSMPTTEVYMAMKLGTIDGYFYSAAELETLKFKEVTKYILKPPWNATLNGDFLVNLDSWNSLDEWQQEAMKRVAKEAYIGMAREYEEFEKAGIQAALEYGCELIEMSPEETQRMIRHVRSVVWSKYEAKTPEFAQGIEILKKFLRDKGRL